MDVHIHDKRCYSNIGADVETLADWKALYGNMAKGPTIQENLLLLAQSQLGYQESTLNFQVDGNGIRRGITRYGQWYGNPYGDWSAMFVSFCLEYAGATENNEYRYLTAEGQDFGAILQAKFPVWMWWPSLRTKR